MLVYENVYTKWEHIDVESIIKFKEKKKEQDILVAEQTWLPMNNEIKRNDGTHFLNVSLANDVRRVCSVDWTSSSKHVLINNILISHERRTWSILPSVRVKRLEKSVTQRLSAWWNSSLSSGSVDVTRASRSIAWKSLLKRR
jgi:hypothetical protein